MNINILIAKSYVWNFNAFDVTCERYNILHNPIDSYFNNLIMSDISAMMYTRTHYMRIAAYIAK